MLMYIFIIHFKGECEVGLFRNERMERIFIIRIKIYTLKIQKNRFWSLFSSTHIICRPTLKYLCVWHHIFIKIVTLKLHRSSIFSKIASHNNYHKKFVSKGQQLGELCNERLSSMKICGILQEQISSIIQTKNQFLCPTLWLI